MALIFRQLFDPASSTYTYVFCDPATKEVAIVDSVREWADHYLGLIRENDWQVRYLIETHIHADHITATRQLQRALPGAEIVMSGATAVQCPVTYVIDGHVGKVGGVSWRVFATPGHTPESLCLLVDDDRLLTGDTLLIGSCGRTDFQSGDTAAMFDSLQRLSRLPQETLVFPGHDYEQRRVSSIGEELQRNEELRIQTLEVFRADVDNWNLPPPARIEEAVPANLRCGEPG
jgi:sulfur dioxygenase